MSAELPVAIVGIGCKFPGGADTKELYYEFLRGKVSVVISPHRWFAKTSTRLITLLIRCRVTGW